MDIRASFDKHWTAYLLAVFFSTVAALLQWGLPSLLAVVPYFIFVSAIIITAAFGGFGPGILATFMAILFTIFLDKTPSLIDFHDPAAWGRLLLFMGSGIGISLISEHSLMMRAKNTSSSTESNNQYHFEASHDSLTIVSSENKMTDVNIAVGGDSQSKSNTFYLHEDILWNLADGITVQDKDYNIVYQNDHIQHIFGNHIGKKCYSIYERRSSPCEECGINKALTTGRPAVVLRTAYGKDGTTSFWENACFPIFDENHNVIAGVEVCRDISARVTLEQEVKERNIQLGQLNEQLKQQTAQLEEALQAREHTERALRLLASKLMNAQESERSRIAREMHDDLTQRIAVLAIEMGKLENEANSQGRSSNTIREIKGNLIKLSQDVHALSRRIHPSIVEELGLAEALHSECSNFTQRENITISYFPPDTLLEISKDVALCLYRITQEGLRNIAKHAGVHEASVSLITNDTGVLLSIEDSGIGFDPMQISGKPGLGLVSMEERVRLIGGDFSIHSEPGKGTLIEVWAPLSRIEA